MISTILRKDLILLWKPALAAVIPYLLATMAEILSLNRNLLDAIMLPLYGVAFYVLAKVVHWIRSPGSLRLVGKADPAARSAGGEAAVRTADDRPADGRRRPERRAVLGFDPMRVLVASLGHAAAAFVGLVLPIMANRRDHADAGAVCVGAFADSIFLAAVPGVTELHSLSVSALVPGGEKDAAALGLGATLVLLLRFLRSWPCLNFASTISIFISYAITPPRMPFR